MNAIAPPPPPDTDPALGPTDFLVRIPVQVKPAEPGPQRGWAHHFLTFRVRAVSEVEAVAAVMGQIRNVQLSLPDHLREGAEIPSLGAFDPFEEPEEPAVP